MVLLKCSCGNEMYPHEARNRDAVTGKLLGKPICRHCAERGVRASVLVEPKLHRHTAEMRR